MKRRIYFERKLSVRGEDPERRSVSVRGVFEEAARQAGDSVKFAYAVPCPDRHAERLYFEYEIPDSLVNMLEHMTID